MNKSTIIKIDKSQIKYTPAEGEVIQDSVSGDFFAYQQGEWHKLSMDKSGLNMGLYDLNKQIISQLPELTITANHKYTVANLHNKYNNEFYMLYGKEMSYFTLFQMKDDPSYFFVTVLDCLVNIGTIKAIDKTENEDAIEIWIDDVESLSEPTCLYLFPYDNGVVPVGE